MHCWTGGGQQAENIGQKEHVGVAVAADGEHLYFLFRGILEPFCGPDSQGEYVPGVV